MRFRGLLASVMMGVAVGALAPSSARAQEAPPFDPAIDVQLFDYAIGPKTFFAVNDASIMAPKQITFDAMVTFLSNPFTVYDVSDDEEIEDTRTQVVKQVLAGELSAAYGLNQQFQIGVSLPVIFSMTGEGLMPATGTPDPDGLKIAGTGDLRAEVKMRLYREGAIGVASTVGITAPTSFGSGGGKFIGDDLPSLRGRGILQWTSPDGRASVGANLGLVFRKPRTIYASTVGQQLTWGLAASYRPTDRFAVIAEGFGRTGLEGLDLDASPAEVEGGVRVQATQAIAVVAGGGAGVVRGIGSPDLRVFVSVGYAPDTRDSDGDGVANNRDTCPAAAEDRDGFEDGNGCPDDDNDADRRDDANDKCPDLSEDFDGFDDDDGCPELDNDGDGIPDLADKCADDREDAREPFATDGCPSDKHDADSDGLMDAVDQCPADTEDADKFEDGDGCPDFDQDQDGVADEDDVCPLCAEDKDGVGDADGCPETDDDGDGVLDAADTCATEAESINGFDDFDGCADDGGALLIQLTDDRATFVRAPTFDRKGLDRGGGIIVDQLALTMLQHRELTAWTIAIAAKTKAEADRQGAAILARLVDRGVREDAIAVLTGVGAPAIVALVKERVDAAPGPSCPAGTEVQERAMPTIPPPAPAMPAPVAPAAAPVSAKPAPAAITPTPVAVAAPAAPASASTVPAAFASFAAANPIEIRGDGFTPTRGSRKVLDDLAALLRANPDVIVTITVADPKGDPSRAADGLRKHLVGKGVAPDQIETEGDLGGTKQVSLGFRDRRAAAAPTAPAPAPETPSGGAVRGLPARHR